MSIVRAELSNLIQYFFWIIDQIPLIANKDTADEKEL